MPDKTSKSELLVLPKPKPKSRWHLERGARNLVFLGVGAILLALVTTSLELLIYRDTGDIYLDRSRPGYLPDAEEAEEDNEVEATYAYPDNGPLNADEFDEYLSKLKEIDDSIQKINNPYSAGPLSDESLGIQSGEQ